MDQSTTFSQQMHHDCAMNDNLKENIENNDANKSLANSSSAQVPFDRYMYSLSVLKVNEEKIRKMLKSDSSIPDKNSEHTTKKIRCKSFPYCKCRVVVVVLPRARRISVFPYSPCKDVYERL